MTIVLSLWCLLATTALGANPGQLLLDYDVRAAFVAEWSPAHLRVRYRIPAGPLQDADMQPTLETAAALVDGARGPEVLAPAALLEGVEQVELVRRDGRTTPARVIAPAAIQHAAAVRVVPEDPHVLDRLPVLVWAPAERVAEHTRGWLLEDSGTRLPDGELAAPVLIDTVLGPPAEPPLDHFLVVPVKQAAGHVVLDHEGRALCFLFRTAYDGEASLCAPRAAITGRPGVPPEKAESLELQQL